MKTYTIKRIKDGATLDGVTDENYWTIQPFVNSMNDLICETGSNDWHRLADVVYVNMIGETEEMKAVDWVDKHFRERELEKQANYIKAFEHERLRAMFCVFGLIGIIAFLAVIF